MKPAKPTMLSPLDFTTLDSSKSYPLHRLHDTLHVHLLHPDYLLIDFYINQDNEKVFVYADKNINRSGGIYKTEVTPVIIKKQPLFTVHGNVYYDVYYQSNIDTPFYERDIYQHTIRTSLDITYKGKYPVRLNFSTRFSNSGMIRDITGIGFNFNPQQFKNTLTDKVQAYVLRQLSGNKLIDSLKRELDKKVAALQQLRYQVERPDLLQQMIEARERAYVAKLHASKDSAISSNINSLKNSVVTVLTNNDSEGSGKNQTSDLYEKMANKKSQLENKADSALQRLETSVAKHKQQYDSLKQEVDTLQQRYQKVLAVYEKLKAKAINNIALAKNPEALQSELQSLGIPDTVLPKGYKKLMALRSVGIGRSIVDYSELSAKNITINGLQVEYNPSYYVAVATGFIDYRFRDYIVNTTRYKQYLNIIRAGYGMKDGNNTILTLFQGKKQVYSYYSSNSGGAVNSPQPDYNIVGFTVEKRYRLDQNNFITAEFGKSSLPYFRRTGEKSNLVSSALTFKDRTNEAYAVKVSSFIPSTQTRINGMYKHTGADYQSFSYFTTSSTQNAWQLKVEQPFLKRRLTFTGSLRKNDFSSPYASNNFQSNTLFKSIQATIRIKKLPIVSLGYFPTAQLIKANDDLYFENYYYTLTGTASHSYRYKGTQINTLLTYIRFYNKQPDSSFVYFNTRNIMLNQAFYFKRVTWQLTASQTKSTDYTLYTTGTNVQLKLREWLLIGGGVKYNNQTIINQQQVGYSANTTVRVPHMGSLQLFVEKGFIPGLNRQLIENKVGRLTFIRNF
ncbi:hypothetical protein I5907_12415 [Panacibacter sp. DH6]|uniref:Uncharacterized protein n=1 Tax=Panacibacter microcysteis TaxID=2793269 RepID=A0A931E3P8_9BACT|nr:hypothetical protein [Panacibacter microcysteis]MBG9377040.1 hypothetical protein [Panacibacter microcysteis]